MSTENAPFKASNELKDLIVDLALAQSEYPTIDTDCNVSYTANGRTKSYKYASLQNVLGKIRPVLAKHGIAFIQTTRSENNSLVVITTLLHKSGQWYSSEYPIPDYKHDAQAGGSALTYARRYSAYAILGLHPDEGDDDGEAATIKHGSSKQDKPKQHQDAKQEPSKQEPSKTDQPNPHLVKLRDAIGRATSVDMIDELENYWKGKKHNLALETIGLKDLSIARQLMIPKDLDKPEGGQS